MALESNRMSVSDPSAIAADSAVVDYGVVESFAVGESLGLSGGESLSWSKRLNFFLGETTGILFIALSAFYIFVMPAALAKPGEIRMAGRRFIKRVLDILGASVGLVLSAPIMLMVALAVKLDSPGPILYSQVRVGVNRRKGNRRYCQQTNVSDRRGRERRREDQRGKPFRIFKFRTMVQNAEKKSGPVWAVQNDPRITRLGRFLRKTRLDELPQFWSILVGDMSLVGPRPERPMFVRQLCEQVEDYHRRLEVKPGLTGLAQIENGYDSSIASVNRKVKFDLDYIRGWTLWSDIRILLRTVIVVFTGKGAC